METKRTKQEDMYIDMVQLIADIAKDSFKIDVIHNPLFSGTFKAQLEKNHERLVSFILKYVPVEPQLEQPKENVIPPDKVDNSKQSGLILSSR